MAIALVAHTEQGSSNGTSVTTSAIDTTGATLLVIWVAYATAATVSDSESNTWTALTARGPDPYGRFYYCKNPTVGTGHTFSVSSSSVPTICVAAFSGTDTSANADGENGGTNAGATTQTSGSLTPSVNNCLVITGLQGISATSSVDSGFTALGNVALAGGQHYQANLAYKVQTTAAAVNPQWTQGTSGAIAVGIAAFKPSAPPTITTTTLPDGVEGRAYSQTVSATGGPTAFSIVAGELPAGLSINNSGVISGTPTLLTTESSHEYSFTVRASNASGYDDQAFTVTVTEFTVPFGDELKLDGLEIESYSLKPEKLGCRFGSGYGASASTGTGSGLWGWEVVSECQPDSSQYGNLINGLARFQYYTQFFLDHTEGDRGEVFWIDFRGKKFHASFELDPEVSGSMLSYDVFSMAGVKLEMRRTAGTIYNDDGSIFEPFAWLRSSSITGKADGDSMVGSWYDYHDGQPWTVASDGTTPTYETNEVATTLPIVRLTDGDVTLDGDFEVYDIFLVMKVNEATFSAARGILSDDVANFLAGSNGTTKFADVASGIDYRLNGTLKTTGNLDAPMNAFGVVHLRATGDPMAFSGRLQIGQDFENVVAGKMDLAEVVVCTTQPSAALFARITNTLKNLYGIS